MDKVELEHRVRSALKFLSEGKGFTVGDLNFNCYDKNHFIVTGWSYNNNLQNITRHSALAELEEIKSLFLKMVNASTELSGFIKDRQIEYNLDYDDGGKCGIRICNEKDGQINWRI